MDARFCQTEIATGTESIPEDEGLYEVAEATSAAAQR